MVENNEGICGMCDPYSKFPQYHLNLNHRAVEMHLTRDIDSNSTGITSS